MGDVDDTPMDDLSDLSTAQNNADSAALDIATTNTQLPSSTSSGFSWSSLASDAGSVLKSIFGGSSKPSTSSSQLAASAAAAQAAQTRNWMLIGGAVVVVGGAILLARRKRS